MSARQILSDNSSIAYEKWMEIDDGENRYSASTRAVRAMRAGELLSAGAGIADIAVYDLFENAETIVSTADGFADASNGEVIFDITSFPKRFFFPILKRFLRSTNVKTLLVTYAEPDRYGDLPLSEDVDGVYALPLFPPRYPEPEFSALVVGLGFQPLGLAEILEGSPTPAVHLLFPLAADQRIEHRVWEFVRSLPETLGPDVLRFPVFVSPIDASEIFDHIVSMGDQLKGYVGLAPFGPKPMSLAMALAATLGDWPVYYTQPRVYRPDYSTGVRSLDGNPSVLGYCLRLDGRDLYTAP